MAKANFKMKGLPQKASSSKVPKGGAELVKTVK